MVPTKLTYATRGVMESLLVRTSGSHLPILRFGFPLEHDRDLQRACLSGRWASFSSPKGAASESSLRGTQPSCHQAIEAKAHLKDDRPRRKLGYQIEIQSAVQLKRSDFRAGVPELPLRA